MRPSGLADAVLRRYSGQLTSLQIRWARELLSYLHHFCTEIFTDLVMLCGPPVADAKADLPVGSSEEYGSKEFQTQHRSPTNKDRLLDYLPANWTTWQQNLGVSFHF
ncbi:unnamed protein product [Protopolystoma xenopodis]|uniref:Uncharacterized protein n=1 Tax=Protopolystoma xenopodis TaxID=117903 RepID=A0A3S5FFM4_9PLAT|nr:unnamed protein product [Protopolystoma xenopodis]